MAIVSDTSVLKTDSLTKTYGSTVAVENVSLEVNAGEIFGLLGPNGAGKTTLIEILQGLRSPTSGQATILGFDLDTDIEAIQERIGVVPQAFHTFERLTVRENVALICDLHSDPLRVETVLEDLELESYADEPFHALSGGYQRRTGIAMALVSDPDILFLDEPTTGLDPAARHQSWEQIAKLPDHGTTVILTSHYMDEVEFLADRVGLLVDGRIEAVDTVSALIDTYGGAVKLIVQPKTPTPGPEMETVEAALESRAKSVTAGQNGEMIGRFDERQQAQDAYSALHDLGTGHAIDLVSADMEDVFLELAGSSLTAEGELQ